MNSDTFRFTSTETIVKWLDVSEWVLRLYRARPGPINDSLAEDLTKQIELVRFIQKSCRLFSVTYKDNRPLYHYELSGPTLTQLRILDPDFIAQCKKNTEHLLAGNLN